MAFKNIVLGGVFGVLSGIYIAQNYQVYLILNTFYLKGPRFKEIRHGCHREGSPSGEGKKERPMRHLCDATLRSNTNGQVTAIDIRRWDKIAFSQRMYIWNKLISHYVWKINKHSLLRKGRWITPKCFVLIDIRNVISHFSQTRLLATFLVLNHRENDFRSRYALVFYFRGLLFWFPEIHINQHVFLHPSWHSSRHSSFYHGPWSIFSRIIC